MHTDLPSPFTSIYLLGGATCCSFTPDFTIHDFPQGIYFPLFLFSFMPPVGARTPIAFFCFSYRSHSCLSSPLPLVISCLYMTWSAIVVVQTVFFNLILLLGDFTRNLKPQALPWGFRSTVIFAISVAETSVSLRSSELEPRGGKMGSLAPVSCARGLNLARRHNLSSNHHHVHVRPRRVPP